MSESCHRLDRKITRTSWSRLWQGWPGDCAYTPLFAAMVLSPGSDGEAQDARGFRGRNESISNFGHTRSILSILCQYISRQKRYYCFEHLVQLFFLNVIMNNGPMILEISCSMKVFEKSKRHECNLELSRLNL